MSIRALAVAAVLLVAVPDGAAEAIRSVYEAAEAADGTTHNYERSGSKWVTLVLLASPPLGHVLIPLALLAGLVGRNGKLRNAVESAELPLGPPGGFCFGWRYSPPKSPQPAPRTPKPARASQPPI